jgi:drug/metabolite transporter (DMT)-like permease
MILLGGYANIAFAMAMIHGEVVRTMMLFYLAPVWGVLGGRIFLGERIDLTRWMGVVLALVGAFLVLGGWRLVSAQPTAVDLLALSSGFAFALNNVTTRAAQGVPQGTKAAAVFIGCALMAMVTMMTRNQILPQVPWLTWSLLVAFGLGWLLVATLATQWGVTCMEAGRASVILILELLVATVSATLIGGERLSFPEMAGGALIFTGAILEALRAGNSPLSPK